MSGWIARCADNAGDSLLVNTEKAMRRACRLHRIQRDLQTAIGAVFKSDRHG